MIFSKIRNQHSFLQKALLFLLTTSLIVLLFPRTGSFKYEFQKGTPWKHETLMAPYDFPILKSDEDISKERAEIKENHKATLVIDPFLFELKAEEFINDFEEKWATDKQVKKDNKFTFFNLFKEKKISNISKKATLANYGLQVLENIYEKGIVQLTDELELKSGDEEVLLKLDNIAKKIELGDLYTIQTASNHIHSLSKLTDQESDFLTPILLDALEQNVFYDQSATEKMLQQELDNLSTARGMVQQGQVIISQGELITDEKYLTLTSYKQNYEGTKLERRF